MKKMITILAVIVCITTTLNVCSYGQDLIPLQGRNSKWGFVDEDRKEIISFIYDDAREFSEGFAAVKLNGKWGFIDETDKEVILFIYDDARKFSDGSAAVKLNHKWGFIDYSGKGAIFKYDDAREFSEGFAAVKLNHKWGFIDEKGNEIIPLKYYDVGKWSEGMVRVGDNNNFHSSYFWWYFIDKNNLNKILGPYDEASDFSEGFAHVRINHYWVYIDKTGKEVSERSQVVSRQVVPERPIANQVTSRQAVSERFCEGQVASRQGVAKKLQNCPYCGEEILAVATKCKHCGEWLDKTATSKVPFKPKKGSFCLEVQFKPLGDIVIQSNPNSIGLGSAGNSAKCFASKKSELRIDLLFGFSKNTNTILPPDTIEGMKEVTRNSTTAFGLNFGMNRHFNGTERISPYIGFLLGFGVDITIVEIGNLDLNSVRITSTKTETFGMNFIVPTGFNWYIVNGLYLGAEVGLGLSFNTPLKEVIEETIDGVRTTTTTNPTSSTFGINFFAAPAIRLGWKF